MHAPHIRVKLMDELHGFDALVCAAGHNSQFLHIRPRRCAHLARMQFLHVVTLGST